MPAVIRDFPSQGGWGRKRERDWEDVEGGKLTIVIALGVGEGQSDFAIFMAHDGDLKRLEFLGLLRGHIQGLIL